MYSPINVFLLYDLMCNMLVWVYLLTSSNLISKLLMLQTVFAMNTTHVHLLKTNPVFGVLCTVSNYAPIIVINCKDYRARRFMTNKHVKYLSISGDTKQTFCWLPFFFFKLLPGFNKFNYFNKINILIN